MRNFLWRTLLTQLCTVCCSGLAVPLSGSSARGMGALRVPLPGDEEPTLCLWCAHRSDMGALQR